MPELPTGTVTFLFTDVEGSTRLLRELGAGYAGVLAEHRRVLREAFVRHEGVEVDTQGDAFFVAFPKASGALAAAIEARDALASGPVKVRMGLHTGEPLTTSEGYVGIDVHRAARIAAVGHGGQILVSQATSDLVGGGLRDLGEHLLKDLAAPERIYQLGHGDFPPLKSLNNSNLPLPPDPLVGRKKELADVSRFIRDSTRLLTITGPGGIGKTRFAVEAAADLINDFRDGVWWVGLAPVREAKLVLPTIATAVGAKGEVATELRSKEMLLLLDNFEQVVDSAPDVAALQSVCPNIVLLVTSREPLHIAGEREYPLAPLAESQAVELLRQRADSMTPGFEADYDELVEVCDRLDRLPLAIELAAARTKVLSIHDLLERLDERLPLLASRRRDVDERQRTLRATIEWSYDLLDGEERGVFARIAVFAGSFDAAAAHDVCDADLDQLESLVDKSLIRGTNDDRFFMLETIREYALGRLGASGKSEAVRRHHAEWIRQLALDAVEPLGGDRQAAVLDDLAREHANIRAALGLAIAANDADLALTIAGSLGRYWVFRGHDVEGHDWLRSALALPVGADEARRWRALYWYGVVADSIGDEAAAFTAAEEGLALARTLADDTAVAASSHELARRLITRGALARAEQLLDESERIVRRTNDLRGTAVVQIVRGQLRLAQGDPGSAVSALTTGVANDRAVGDMQGVAYGLAYLALAEAALGKETESRAAARESLELSHQLHHAWGIAACLQAIAGLALARGDADDAVAMLLLADALLESLGVTRSGAEAELYRQTREQAQSHVPASHIEGLRQSLPPAEVEEAVAFGLSYLD